MSDKDSGSGGSEKSRHRRLNKISANRRVQSPHCKASAIVSSPLTGMSLPNSVGLDGITFLSSPLKAWQVISSFDARKREIVESIGFGGLLSLPCISYENKSFSYWLLNRLKWFTRSVHIGDNIGLTITAQHIGKISGLNYSGIDISDDSLETVSEKLGFIKSNLGFLDSETAIVELAERFVCQEFSSVYSKEQADNFKIAFVIFVMGRFLAPSSEHPDGNTNFWGALKNPDEIGSYNWSAYVLENILEAGRLVNWAIPRNKQLSKVIGCTLIIQILYLDNIDLGQLNLPHNQLPRWGSFSNDRLDAMVKADIVVPIVGSSTIEYGYNQTLRQGSTCYWGITQHVTSSSPSSYSPSPPLYPTSTKHAPRQHHRATMSNNLEQINFPNIQSPLPTLFKTTPSLGTEVLDFAAIIRDKFQGQVDAKVLDELKLYNARCLNHIYKSYRSLAASIVNENANIALKLLESNISAPLKTTTELVNDNSATRRRTYREFLSGTESSTEGEDNTMHSKMARSRAPSFSSGVPCNAKKTVGGIKPHNVQPGSSSSVFKDPSQNSKNHNAVPAFGKPSSLIDPGHSNLATASLTGLSPARITSETICPTPHNENFQLNTPSAPSNALVPSKHVVAECQTDGTKSSFFPTEARQFETPEASIKMFPSSPNNVSQNTENMLFSGACLAVRVLESINGIDLNASAYEYDYNSTMEPKKQASPGPLSSSHWKMNLHHPATEPFVYNAFFDWLTTTSSKELERNWLVHDVPRYIKLTGQDIKDQFVLKKPMTFELMDVAIRRMKQLDNYIYPSDVPLRWRHLIESDYAMHVLGAENPIENRHIREQFVGSVADYKLSRCRMFFVPVNVNGIWWCYAWDLKANVVVIMDPTASAVKDDIVFKKHAGTIDQLAESLSSIISDLFTGWFPKFSSSNCVVLRVPGMPYACHDSGFISLFCIWNFDGQKLAVDCTESNLKNFKAYMLYQLMEMEHNSGRSPSVEIID